MKQYIVRHSHEPIIEPEVFDRVQELIAKRRPHKAKLRDTSPFCNKLVCGDCGGFYGHKVWHNRANTERYDIWYCNHKYEKTEKCQTPFLREDEIKTAFEIALKKYGDSDPAYSDARWRETVEFATVCQDRHFKFLLTSGEEIEIAL